MVHNISGLLITLKQMHEMVSHLSQKPVTELVVAYQVCRAEALKFQTRRLPTEFRFKENQDRISIV